LATEYSDSPSDLKQEIEDLKRNQAVYAAEQAGAQATQAATQAGDTATQAATHAGTWSTMVAAAAGFIVGIFLALAFVAVVND
jgi:hypothetical protein